IGKKPLAIIPGDRGQKLEIVIAEAEGLEIGDRLLEAGGDGVAAVERILAKEEMKDRIVAVLAALPIAVRHCELVEIGQERGRDGHGPACVGRRERLYADSIISAGISKLDQTFCTSS